MRLWHQFLIPKLPRQQLLGQHRECCALRGAGWGRNHSVVNYVFATYHFKLVAYHYLVMNEMKRRGYHPDEQWYNVNWRGKTLGFEEDWTDKESVETVIKATQETGIPIYSEHNDAYLQECIDNLKQKGIDI
jgi:uncharacterized protein (TIGR02328 family)